MLIMTVYYFWGVMNHALSAVDKRGMVLAHAPTPESSQVCAFTPITESLVGEAILTLTIRVLC